MLDLRYFVWDWNELSPFVADSLIVYYNLIYFFDLSVSRHNRQGQTCVTVRAREWQKLCYFTLWYISSGCISVLLIKACLCINCCIEICTSPLSITFVVSVYLFLKLCIQLSDFYIVIIFASYGPNIFR